MEIKRINFKREDLIENPLWYHKKNLQETISGFGHKLRTEYMVMHNNRKKRVYCSIHSNSGTLFIMQGKEQIIVNVEDEYR